ncbi:Hypothetical protein POVR1_LOCUS60 [uncultured virus]|nr:Hypothetical protein POVR1_LOCUS60 [uncultured virus]
MDQTPDETTQGLSSTFLEWVSKTDFDPVDQLKAPHREDVDRVWEALDSKALPDRFMAVLVAYSRSKNYNEAVKEWNLIKSEKPEYNTEGTKCICSKDIDRLYPVTNSLNGNTLYIGSSCIDKFCTDDLKSSLKVAMKAQKYQGENKMCKGCCNYRLPPDADSWKYCKSCFEAGVKEPCKEYRDFAKYKTCVECGENVIEPTDWRDKCYGCYKALMEYARECCDCGEKKILPTEEDYVTKCRECYNKSRTNMRACVHCQQPKIPADSPAWKNSCPQCYKRGMESGRPCATTGCKNVISAIKPSYVTMCVGCFKNSKSR